MFCFPMKGKELDITSMRNIIKKSACHTTHVQSPDSRSFAIALYFSTLCILNAFGRYHGKLMYTNFKKVNLGAHLLWSVSI